MHVDDILQFLKNFVLVDLCHYFTDFLHLGFVVPVSVSFNVNHYCTKKIKKILPSIIIRDFSRSRFFNVILREINTRFDLVFLNSFKKFSYKT